MTDYTPIDCSLYAGYEVAILRRQRLMLSWRDETGVARVGVVSPTDLQTREGEEFLLGETQEGSAVRVRLDRIIQSKIVSVK